ncbi:hypothetical protein [Salegentibacter sp. Hel_I_6]|uniref:hypothetical protein n=1 Tax=Salegentibacter sp. Hel_I_6 TaxID=1250278 RepID=UPI00055F10FC|nr:hypothetical protein [Salegentibacter sp. Hel_I_6]
MKNKIKLLTSALFLGLMLQSCSSESEEALVNASELEQELALENDGVLKVESATYVFKKTGETAKFLENDRDFHFKFLNELSYQFSETDKHAIEGLTITNPETEEYLVFSNFEELKSGFFKFDLEFSTGQTLSSVLYKPGKANTSSNKWHGDPMLEEPSNVIGAMIELSQQESVRQCRAASQVCSNTNGVPTVALTNGKGWFTQIEACALECHD